MALKKKNTKVEEVRKLLGTDKLVIGTDRTLKGLKQGKIQRVYLASNTDEKIKEAIQHYCKLGKVELIKLNKSNDDLGAFCKKPFRISVLSIAKE